MRPDGRAGCLGCGEAVAAKNEITAARSVWLPDAWRVSSNEQGAVPGVERRRCVQWRPVVVTGSGKRRCLEFEVCGGGEVPDRRCEEF